MDEIVTIITTRLCTELDTILILNKNHDFQNKNHDFDFLTLI